VSPAEAVPLCARLDAFHTCREGGRALRHAWQQAEAVWQEAEELERARARVGRRGADRRGFNRGRACAWRRAAAALEEAQRQERAGRRAAAALAVFRPDGTLNDRTWASAELRAAVAGLPGRRWAKARRALLDPRRLAFLDRLHEDLAAAEPRPEVRAELVACWGGRRGRRAGPAAPAWAVV
jgi:hypothetical protein